MTDKELQTKLLNDLVVSGGYISTERDEVGNILLYEDPNNIGSNKQLVTQWISVDLARRDYDAIQLKKVFDTEINELYKLPKTKTVAELRAEMERLRQLLAAASGEIVVVENVIVQGGGDGTSGTSGTSGQTGFTELQSDDRIAPFILYVEGYTINIQTAIWDTENRRIRPDEINRPEQAVKYSIIKYNTTGEILGTFESKIASPEVFQGWYYDKENLGNTDHYVSLNNQSSITTIDFSKDREGNQGPEKEFTLVVAYKDEAPNIETTDRIRVQLEAYDPVKDLFLGNRDDITADFVWTLRDSEGNVVNSSDETNPFELNVLPGQRLTVSLTQAQQSIKAPLHGWYVIDGSNRKILLPGATGNYKNVITFTIPSDIKGLIAAYNSLV